MKTIRLCSPAVQDESQVRSGYNIQTATAVAICCWLAVVEFAPAQSWSATTAPSTNWVSICSSADGNRLAGLVANGGAVYISTNAGAFWAVSSPPNGAVLGTSIASSANGSVLATVGAIDATGEFAGNAYISTNGGGTWFTTSPYKSWTAIACSADGTMMAGASALRRSFGAGILISFDSGQTWTSSGAPNDPWLAIASSGDGTQLVAADNFDGSIHISGDSGATWSVKTPQPQGFTSVATSADGTTLVAASGNNGSGSGPIYFSKNAGTTWTQGGAPMSNWVSVACSVDGTRLVAAGGGSAALGRIYTSTDSGETWTAAKAPLAHWTSVTSSADGTKLAATVYGGHIYSLQLSPFTLSPLLSLSTSRTQAVISWLMPSMKFALQQNSDLISNGWVAVTNDPALNTTNIQYEVSLPLATSGGFYRLVSQ